MPRVHLGFGMPGERRDKTGRATYLADLNRALALVTGHVEAAWMIDHLQFGAADVLESFTTLAYLAALHPRLTFGHHVVCQSFRNPALVAKMGATLQFLSGGRFILGLGAGWHAEEYRAYGYDFPPGHVRVAQLEEALRIIRAMWTQERATVVGTHYRVVDAHCEPRPVPLPPLLIGAFRPRMLRLAARYADWWDVSSVSIGRYRRLAAEFERACAEVGRDPATVRRSWSGGCACAPTRAAAEALAGGWESGDEDDFDFLGTPAEVAEQMRPFIDLGVDTFVLDGAGFPRLTTLELLIDAVLPTVNA